MISSPLDVTAPALLVVPPDAESLDEAHAAIELWEHYSRKVLDPAQRVTVEVMMAQTSDGRWAAATTGREMARQNGKGDEVEVVELWGLVQRAEAILHTVHDAVLLASQAQQRMLGVLEGHGDLRRLVKRKWQGTGQQMIELRNGGVIWYRTRTGGGGRGVDDIDRLVIDEAQHATEEQLAAVSPTLFANANPQMNVMGTAGLAGRSGWWWSIRRRAMSKDPGAFGYVGHTAERLSLDSDGRIVQAPVDVEDRDLWMKANPAVVAGRGQGLAFLEEQFLRLGPASFAREHLCVWDAEPGEGVSFVPVDDWRSLGDQNHKPSGPVRYALDVDTNPSGETWATIGASDGTHVEVVKSAKGTAWVVPACVEKKQVIGKLLVAKDSPAAALIADLEAAGVEVQQVHPGEFAQASMQMLDAVVERTLRHLDQTELNTAVERAARRTVGDGQWRWSRKLSQADIGPLCALSMARWARQGRAMEPMFAVT